MEHSTRREAGGPARPQTSCSPGALGLLSRGQGALCCAASSAAGTCVLQFAVSPRAGEGGTGLGLARVLGLADWPRPLYCPHCGAAQKMGTKHVNSRWQWGWWQGAGSGGQCTHL